MRYKRKHVVPAFVIPGPNNPKNIDSFIYLSFYHLAAIQKEGLSIWDSSEKSSAVDHPFCMFAAADGPGLALLNGLVGHHGFKGCRTRCQTPGQRKPNGGPHYYPVLLKPHNYDTIGSDHGDVSAAAVARSGVSTTDYQESLAAVLAAPNET